MKRSRKTSHHENLWLVVGLVILSASLLWHRHEQTKLSFVPSSLFSDVVTNNQQQPEFITIENANIFLPVRQTSIHEGIWSIAKDGASHLATSAYPGTSGNIIIYAHNTLDRFAALPRVNAGTTVILQTRAGKKYSYTVYKTEIVSPSNIEILKAEHPHELTLYTCYGFADLKRFVVKAIPSGDDADHLSFDR